MPPALLLAVVEDPGHENVRIECDGADGRQRRQSETPSEAPERVGQRQDRRSHDGRREVEAGVPPGACSKGTRDRFNCRGNGEARAIESNHDARNHDRGGRGRGERSHLWTQARRRRRRRRVHRLREPQGRSHWRLRSGRRGSRPLPWRQRRSEKRRGDSGEGDRSLDLSELI